MAQASTSLSKTYERLASGQRINSASDDAAGLAIADGLRTKTRLYTQSIRNISDGISALHIADGALDAQGGILTRMMELAEQSANGTYSDTQRAALDREFQSLAAEFGRQGDATSFNGRSLLLSGRGSNPLDLTVQAGVDGNAGSRITTTLLDSGSMSGALQISGDVAQLGGGSAPDGQTTIDDLLAFANFASASGVTRAQVESFFSSAVVRSSVTDSSGAEREILFAFGDGYTNGKGSITAFVKNSNGTYNGAATNYFNYSSSTGKVTGAGTVALDLSATLGISYSLDLRGLTFANSISWSGGAYNQTINTTAIDFSNVASSSAALRSLTVLQARMDQLSASRGSLGASLSRLESALSTASVARESNQNAEAQIRDADIAQETAALTRFQILQQVSAQVLGLANQQPARLLDLLRG